MAEPRRRFRFLKELAQGGFGKVYLAEMITGDNFSSVVAIKVLHSKWVDNDEVVMRSRDEARLLGRLRHRSIVRVEDLTAIQGQCAIVMEYLQGVDLKTISNALREQGKPFPRQSMFEVIGAIASALDAAYNHMPLQGGESLKVIHRDIKPSNAMITIEGDVKVLDFGTARASFDDREAKTQALAFGSAAYMAPERLMGEEDHPAGDIFSLGITLYELLTLDSFGKIHIRPERFEKTVAERLESINLTGLPEAMHDGFREVMRNMLAYEPEDRPTSAQVVELMEVFSEAARDGGLKRFARESVKDIIESHVSEQDPNDPLTGTLVYEDSSGFVGPFDGSGAQFSPGQLADGTSGGMRISGPSPVPLPGQITGASGAMGRSNVMARGGTSAPRAASTAPRPGATNARPATSAPRPVTGGAPPPPKPAPLVEAVTRAPDDEDENPFTVPDNLAEAPAELPVGRPSVGVPPPAPPQVQTVTPRGIGELNGRGDGPSPAGLSRPEPSVRSSPPPAPPPEPESSTASGVGKIVVVLGLLGMFGVVLAVVAFFVLRQTATTAEIPPVDKPVIEGASSKLVKGDPQPDFAANAEGKGGVILTVPGGASEVTVTSSSTEFRTEWDGSGNLRLKDLEPGVLLAKVKPKGGGPSVRADFSVEAGSTCVFTFNTGGGKWEKSECR
ncbi:MAG: serine/threonine-protein kinase [Pseudomonadota bacterium]|nr:serine/threonine-protein kinase [Pseudomonadota bacterium]